MKKYSILFIDDKKDEVEPFIYVLSKEGHTVDYRESPNQGISKACHHYDLMFIDFLFEGQDIDGSHIGIELRKKCPLVPLVLLTANGRERIRDFIFVGFDDYFDKHIDGEKAADKLKRLRNCLTVAINNSQKRIKSKFNSDELKTIEIRLDALEVAFTQNTKNRSAAAILSKVLSEEKKHYGNKHTLTRNRLITSFTLEEKKGSGVLNEDALKTRQLLMENPSKWPLTREYFPKIKLLVNEFNI